MALLWTLAAAVGLTVVSSPADVVRTTAGTTLRGIIVEETPDSVELLVTGLSRVAVPRGQIEDIERESEAENALTMGDLHFEQQMLWEATQHWSLALEQGLSPAPIAERILERPASVAALISNLPEEQAPLCRSFLLQVLREIPPHDELYYLAGRICEVTGEEPRALRAYLRIDERYLWTEPEQRRVVSQFIHGQARQAMERGDLDEVFELLTELNRVDPSLADELQPLFMLRSANTLMERGEWEDAMALVSEGVMRIAPQIGEVWLESVFSEMEHSPHSPEDLERVIRLFEQHHPLHFTETEQRLATLLEAQGQMLMASGRHGEARRVFQRLGDYADDPTEAQRLMERAEFLDRGERIPREDVERRISLIREMVDAEQWEAARTQLDLLPDLDESRFRAYVIQQRHAIEGHLAQQRWVEAFDLYQSGSYPKCLDALNEHAELFQSARLLEEMNQLRAMCERRMAEEETMRELQALSRFQEAERRFYLGSYQAALPLYQEVLRSYPDTAAARDAARRLREARRRLAVRGNPSTEDLENLRRTLEEIVESTAPAEERQRQELESMLDSLDRQERGPDPL